MVLTAIVACLIGIGEFICNIFLFPAVFSGNFLRVGLLLLLKIAVYALSLFVLIHFFVAYVMGAAVGFGVGFIPALFLYGVYSIGKNKGEKS